LGDLHVGYSELMDVLIFYEDLKTAGFTERGQQLQSDLKVTRVAN
jgi:hypothetical protein